MSLTLILCLSAAPCAGATPGDEPAKAAPSIHELFQAALGSCCAQGTCAEEGGCLAPCAACAAQTCSADHVGPAERCVMRLAKDPSALRELRPQLEACFRSDEATDGQRRFAAMALTWCPGEEAAPLAESLFGLRAQAFPTDALIAFAARGSAALERGLRERGAAGEVRAAAWVAWTDADAPASAASRAALERLGEAVDGEASDELVLTDALVAGLTLARLGDPEPLTRLVARSHAAVLASLDAGRVAAARSLASILEYFTTLAHPARPADLGHLGLGLAQHVAKRAHSLPDANAVFELVERIAPATAGGGSR